MFGKVESLESLESLEHLCLCDKCSWVLMYMCVYEQI